MTVTEFATNGLEKASQKSLGKFRVLGSWGFGVLGFVFLGLRLSAQGLVGLV